MNEEDIKAVLSEYFELLDPSSRYLISLSPYFVNHVSTSLLDHLVNSRGKSCLYICIGRPHIFIGKILSNRGIDLRKITFMDMALHIGQPANGEKDRNSIVVDNEGEGLKVPAIFKLFRFDQEIVKVDIRDFDMIVIDNLTELSMYNNREQIEDFIDLFHSAASKCGKGLFLYRVNTGREDYLVSISAEAGIEHLEIPDRVIRERM